MSLCKTQASLCIQIYLCIKRKRYHHPNISAKDLMENGRTVAPEE